MGRTVNFLPVACKRPDGPAYPPAVVILKGGQYNYIWQTSLQTTAAHSRVVTHRYHNSFLTSVEIVSVVLRLVPFEWL